MEFSERFSQDGANCTQEIIRGAFSTGDLWINYENADKDSASDRYTLIQDLNGLTDDSNKLSNLRFHYDDKDDSRLVQFVGTLDYELGEFYRWCSDEKHQSKLDKELDPVFINPDTGYVSEHVVTNGKITFDEACYGEPLLVVVYNYSDEAIDASYSEQVIWPIEVVPILTSEDL